MSRDSNPEQLGEICVSYLWHTVTNVKLKKLGLSRFQMRLRWVTGCDGSGSPLQTFLFFFNFFAPVVDVRKFFVCGLNFKRLKRKKRTDVTWKDIVRVFQSLLVSTS